MARYDGPGGRWTRGGSYDGSYRQSELPRGETPGYAMRDAPPRRDASDQASWHAMEGGAGQGIYGPGRYGLGPYHQRLRSRRRPDEDLRKEVEEALFFDTWVDAESITVEVKDGVVTLRGELPSYEEVRYATDDAWDVDGVLGVRSQLTVGEE